MVLVLVVCALKLVWVLIERFEIYKSYNKGNNSDNGDRVVDALVTLSLME